VLTSREQSELRALRSRANRERAGRFLAEGVRVVEDLLASRLEVRWVLSASSLEDNPRGRALLDAVDSRGIPLRRLPDAEFQPLAATDAPQGVIAVADIPARSIDDLDLSRAPAVVLVLDAVQDPGNFGTLVRSAEALGAAGVVALKGCVDAWNPKVVRAAAGSSFRLPVVPLSWSRAAGELRGRGCRLLGADVSGDPVAAGWGDRAALVVGNEGAGLSAEVRAEVDGVVGIPLRGRAESLNVAAAAAILLYELTR
jgi:RNA methyltransferase, TrmH family